MARSRHFSAIYSSMPSGRKVTSNLSLWYIRRMSGDPCHRCSSRTARTVTAERGMFGPLLMNAIDINSVHDRRTKLVEDRQSKKNWHECVIRNRKSLKRGFIVVDVGVNLAMQVCLHMHISFHEHAELLLGDLDRLMMAK